MGANLSNFREGDEVMIGIKELDVIEQMQESHGGWNDKMKECMKGPCKLIQGVGTDVLVKGPSGGVYRLNPDILIKYVSKEHKIGSKVTIISKEDEMKQLQVGHGGWSDGMKELLGKSVDIVQKFPDGDYKIKYADRTWTLNPDCFVAIKTVKIKQVTVGESVTIVSNKSKVMNFQENHGGWSELMSMVLGQVVEVVDILDNGDCVITKYGMKWIINPACFDNESEEEEKKGEFYKGDTVRVSNDLEKCKELQKYHGGWVSAMKSFLGKVAVVDSVLPTGDVKVTVSGMSFVFNAKLLTKVDSASPSTGAHVTFSVGDRVKVLKDKNKVKQLQKNHGEWIESMRLILGEKGKVKSIFPDGDLRVKVMGNVVTLNPECVKKVVSNSDSDSDVPDVMKMMRRMATMLGTEDSDKSDDDDSSTSTVGRGQKMTLLAAVKSGDIEKTRTLVDVVGPNISTKKICPLMVAVNEGHDAIVELLLDKGANINSRDSDGDTPLHLAVQKNRIQICKILVKRGANINEQNDVKMTPVMLAAVMGAQDTLAFLVTVSGVDLNIGDKDKDTALHLAIQKSRLDSVEILLDAGADIRALNEKQFSCFHMAALRGHEKILEAFLLKSGPSIVDMQKEDYFAAIHLTALNNHPGCLKVLIKHKADINIRNAKMQTALHIAVSQKYLECVKILVENKAELNLKDESGDTPLHDGIRGHNMERMKKLGSMFGMSEMFKLIEGVQKGSDKSEDIVMYLVEKGAKLDIKNNSGKTAITFCEDDMLKAKLMSVKEGTGSEETPRENKDSLPAPSAEQDLERLKLQIEKLEDEKICKICCDRKIDCTFGCGHVSCEVCARNLNHCHMCRSSLDNIIKMYR